MDLYRIQNDLIADRSADAWFSPKIAGPAFHYRWQFGTSSSGPFNYISGEHMSHAVCREEPSLTMAWGLDVHDHDERRELHFDWAQDFVNTTVRPFWVDFFWNNALIDRVELCSIDGGHGIIPIPNYEMKVTDFEVAVAYLIHGLNDSPSHDHPGRYLDSLEIKRIPDHDRQGAGTA